MKDSTSSAPSAAPDQPAIDRLLKEMFSAAIAIAQPRAARPRLPGRAASDIASGPAVPDPTTCTDALAILKRYAIDVSPAVTALLESGRTESPIPGDPRLPHIETHLIATPQLALEAAAREARAAGIDAHILGDSIEGEARDVGAVMAGIAKQVRRRGQPFKAPCVLLSGGETTVTIRGDGRGGRNVEFLLGLGVALNGEPGVFAIAGDTDGVDGQEEFASAVLMPDSLSRARERGIRPADRLENNDAHGFFQALGDSVVTPGQRSRTSTTFVPISLPLTTAIFPGV